MFIYRDSPNLQWIHFSISKLSWIILQLLHPFLICFSQDFPSQALSPSVLAFSPVTHASDGHASLNPRVKLSKPVNRPCSVWLCIIQLVKCSYLPLVIISEERTQSLWVSLLYHFPIFNTKLYLPFNSQNLTIGICQRKRKRKAIENSLCLRTCHEVLPFNWFILSIYPMTNNATEILYHLFLTILYTNMGQSWI